jgi:ferredoxin
MPNIVIDGRETDVTEGTTVLEAARSLSIPIPTLCHRPGGEPYTSCMVCLVRETKSGKMIPSCSARAEAGMVIETVSEAVLAMRREALELLLGDHVGDCTAPCTRVCPAGMDAPGALRALAQGRAEDAAVAFREGLALPAVLGRVCLAPCEKACRRARHDRALPIRALERAGGDDDFASETPEPSGKGVAVVGTGPAGLAGAFFLLKNGHAVTLFDEGEEPGGGLRRGIDSETLPLEVLDAEVEGLRRLGAEFRLKVRLGEGETVEGLRSAFDAVVLALGEVDARRASSLGIHHDKTGIPVDANTLQTGRPGVFAAGASVRPVREAVRSVGQGKRAAASVHRFLVAGEGTPPPSPFESRLGSLLEGEMAEFLKGVPEDAGPGEPGDGAETPSREDARTESARCLHCDCRKAESCGLRRAATEVSASQKRYRRAERRRVERVDDHPDLVFEPGKCILCGLCVRIAKEEGEPVGLAFTGRGFDARVSVPFGDSLATALTTSAKKCVETCPTGALSFR